MTDINIEQTRETDLYWMNRALDLAGRARGRVAPNPAVGAVLVRDGELIGEGATEPPGGRHAEIVALDAAGDRARGSTLYVTLEPCAHYGRTPPCLTSLLDAGISRAVIAVRDPYHLVNGRSIQCLAERGVDVEVGVGADEAARMNAGFFKRIQTGYPEVLVKYAMSLDGRIATHTGHSRWITGPEARAEAHLLRDQADAILVGIGTLLADDPQLTTRVPLHVAGNGGPHHPLRVVVDSQARTPANSRLLDPNTPGNTVVAVTDAAATDRIERLQKAGADVIVLPAVDGHVDLTALLKCLGDRGINSLMVEGGGEILGSLFDACLVDRVAVFVAPVLIGGAGAAAPIQGTGPETMDGAHKLMNVEIQRVGQDMMITGDVSTRHAPEETKTCSPGS